MPYDDFHKSADCLDKKRCFKQVLETSQILNTLQGRSEGWKNHPAVKMWRGHETALVCYYNVFWTVCKEKWKVNFVKLQKKDNLPGPVPYPPWFGDERFHSSMRANLIRKNPEWYGQFGWTEKPQEGYWWPHD